MAFYTGKGDNGTTKTLASNERVSKTSAVIEALGAIDELNAHIGLVKVIIGRDDFDFLQEIVSVTSILYQIQNDIFIIQAELAGANKNINWKKVEELEKIIKRIERSLPEITTFLMPGGSELSAQLDICRTVARRAERRIIDAQETISDVTIAYMNRLSSLLYALVRLANYEQGVVEEPPQYF